MAVGYNNLVEVLSLAASETPEKIAYHFISDDTSSTLTYAQLERRAKALAAILQSFLCQGERGMLLLPPGLDYLVAFFGCLYAGVIPVPAYPPRRNHHGQRLRAIGQNAKAKFILTQDVFADQCQFAPHVVTLDNLDEKRANAYKKISIELNDLAFLQYTSGSTSSPKGVMISHKNILSNLSIIQFYFSEQSEKICSWLPFYHDMGLIGGILYPLYVRQPVYLMAPTYFLQSPMRWLELISKERITTSVAPNFAYDLCVKRVTESHLQTLDLTCWHYALNGAEPIRYETMSRFSKIFSRCGFLPSTFRPVYGLAEATLIVSAAHSGKWDEPVYFSKSALGLNEMIESSSSKEDSVVLVSCGRSPENHEIEIINPETLSRQNECQIGEIWVTGPSIAIGYWDNSDLTKTALKASLKGEATNTYLRTGDLGFKYQGELFVTGRTKDLIIINGVNHYPQDIEQTVCELDFSFQPHGTAAFSIEKNGIECLIVMQEITRTYLNKIQPQSIFNKIKTAVLTEHGLQVESIILLKPHSLPKTSSGKIQRWICRDLLNRQDQHFIAEWHKSRTSSQSYLTNEPNDPLFAWMVEWLSKRTEVTADIQPSDSLALYGFNSLLAAEFAADVQSYLGRSIDPVGILEQSTCHDLLNFLKDTSQVFKKTSLSPQKPSLVRKTTHPLIEDAKHIYFNLTEGVSRDTTLIDSKKMINFAGYNYLGMSGDPLVTAAVIEAVKKYGTSVSASRIASGEKTLHLELEKALAQLIGTENCLVYSSGHATNVSVISHLFGTGDLIIHDSLCHNSILQGILFSGAERIAFPHNDFATLRNILDKSRNQYDKVMIISEGIFSMDGDIPDVTELVQIKEKYAAFLMLDEAHSIGTLGKTGAGIREYFDLNPNDVDIWMGTLSKAFASCGGYIAGSNELIEELKYHAAGFIYSAGISPANTAAALASVQLMKQEPQRIESLQKRHTLLLNLLRDAGVPTGTSYNTPIIPIITEKDRAAIELSVRLKEQGIYAIPIFYPAVEKGKARVRLFINCLHSEEQIYFTAKAIVENHELLLTS